MQLADLFVYAYPMLWALMALGIVSMIGAYIQTKRPHTITATIVFLAALAYFVTVGRLSFFFPPPAESIETRFTLAGLAIAILLHFGVAGWEEYILWRYCNKEHRQDEESGIDSAGTPGDSGLDAGQS